MFISRECDYAVRIVRQLVKGGKKRAEDICAAEFISVQFAYKILKKLEESGIVKVFRGVQGGYTLAKASNEITLYDIYVAMEDNLVLIDCLQEGYVCPMDFCDKPCSVHKEFDRIQKIMASLMSEKTMDVLLV